MKNAIIIGAGSTIASCVIDKLAAKDFNIYLLARDSEALLEKQQDLNVKYPNANIFIQAFDVLANSMDQITEKINICFDTLGTVEVVLIAYGTLPNQKLCENDLKEESSALRINGVSVLEICHHVANKLQLQKSGTLAVITSVAGLRGRQSNYIYGAAKSMVNIYLQGLRNRVNQYGVQVLTVMPGFVDTKMTAEFKKGLLWAKPGKVADDIVNAIFKKKDIIYTPWFWRYIMLIIKSIPESIFKKMKL
ncbi:MAG: short-chain dehydrogenase [Burkholderiales bacterium]|nr:short-chain dehydrogenase [Burkholderiales bacterium]